MNTVATPRVLVIEDIRTLNFPCVYARTTAEAEPLLFGQAWDAVWFDFDMAETMEDLAKPTGTVRGLVRKMEKMAQEGTILPIRKVVVHTMNPAGRAEIIAALGPWYELRVVRVQDYLAPGETD